MESPEKTPVVAPGWWSRHWRWFVPVLVIVVLLLAGAVGWYAMVGKNLRIKYSEPYRLALAQVQKDPKMTLRLGEPIRDATRLPSGSVENDRGRADFYFDVAGPKGKAKIQAQASRIGDRWGFSMLTATFDDGTRATLDVGDGDDAPKFNAGGVAATKPIEPLKPIVAPPKTSPSPGEGPEIKLELPK